MSTNDQIAVAAPKLISGQASNADKTAHRKLLIAGAIGTTIEWYDFFIYGLIAPVAFERLLFPKVDPTVGTIAVFATFAVGFVARPLGGLVFGHFGDRIGRKSVLLTTMLIMGLATMLIGFLPAYEAVGIVTTVALVFLRFLQGFALGGESTAAGLMAIESADEKSRGFSGSIIQAAWPIGVVFASLSTLLITKLPEAELLSWGWRVPFVASGILVGIGLHLRCGIDESKTFKESARVSRLPALEAMKGHTKPILIVFFIELAQTSYFYLTAIFTLAYATRELGIARDVLAQAVLVANIFGLFLVPLFGAWSDRSDESRSTLSAWQQRRPPYWWSITFWPSRARC
ncbi:MFS transporter [Bradyrhizobium liaoningense]|uniref:MFS transporter n=1 Tax=Bradyrhizobium liaoningense TaxID=43992 RepID=UPI001FE83907|nr:MFS transporter [Bradyrhizobium liaoningense]